MATTNEKSDPLLEVVEKIRVGAREAGLVIFYGYVAGEDGSVFWNEEHGHGWQEFLACAKALGARALYLNWVPFEEFQIDEALEQVLPLEEDASADLAEEFRDFRQNVEAYRDKVGLTATVDLAFALEGVFHIFNATADWFAAFGDLAPKTEDSEGVSHKLRAHLVEEWAPKLANDPGYVNCKNHDQQEYLLKKLVGAKFERLPVDHILSSAKSIFEVDVRPESEKRLREQVRELKSQGSTLSAISGKLGISVWRVRSLLGEQTG